MRRTERSDRRTRCLHETLSLERRHAAHMEVRQYPMRIFRFEEGQDDTG
nr:MAG TPA: hypothetical protein [Caudoviricetes sp.]